jgi:hypothetical protein
MVRFAAETGSRHLMPARSSVDSPARDILILLPDKWICSQLLTMSEIFPWKCDIVSLRYRADIAVPPTLRLKIEDLD